MPPANDGQHDGTSQQHNRDRRRYRHKQCPPTRQGKSRGYGLACHNRQYRRGGGNDRRWQWPPSPHDERSQLQRRQNGHQGEPVQQFPPTPGLGAALFRSTQEIAIAPIPPNPHAAACQGQPNTAARLRNDVRQTGIVGDLHSEFSSCRQRVPAPHDAPD